MSEYPNQGGQQNFNKSQAFAAALQRAKQIAAKINPAGDTGSKRPLDDTGSDSEPKKMARLDSPPRQPSLMTPGLSSMGPITSEDIKVPDKMVGLIIGRGGEQITRLQSESSCKIQMAPDSGGMPDRICTLTGSSAAISRAKELVNAIVHQRYKTEGPSGGRMDDLPSQQPHNPSFVEVMIPGAKVGLVIGKGGETIKALQEKSGAKMVVIQDGPSQEAEKPLRITGDPNKVEHARALVYELLAEKENQGGRGGGGGGRGGRNSGFGDRGAGPGGQNARPGGGGFGSSRNSNSGGEESTFIVPAGKCGVIIGRGGETIKQINQTTGAHCELDRRPHPNPNEKVFIIRGSLEQIESAKQMISDKLGGGVSGGYQGGGGAQGGHHAGGFNAWPGSAPGGYNQYAPMDGQGAAMMGQQQQQPAPQQSGGQPDYSQQWIEYYRSLGLHQEADAIEQQTKGKSGGNPSVQPVAAHHGNGTVAPGQGNVPGQQNVPGAGAPGGVTVAAAGAGVAAHGAASVGAANGQPDYSAQWAQYYRSLGKIKEAELIEQQMKSKASGGAGGAQQGPAQSAAAAAAAAAASPYAAAYGAPGTGAAPGAPYQSYQPYPYQSYQYPQLQAPAPSE